MKGKWLVLAVGFSALLLQRECFAQMRITEYEYDGSEFVEFTNIGASSVNMNGWSFDDSSRLSGSTDLSAFGIVVAGQSVIMSEASSTDFATAWGLTGVSIIGGNLQNLGRSDELNLYDNGGALVDRLTYNDQTIAGSPRTNTASGNPKTLAALGANDASQWVLSANGDSYGSHTSVAPAAGLFGNPGVFQVPEPTSFVLAGLGIAGLCLVSKRRNRSA
jgi:predicted extracellular nuclease